jgi:hypothetical protein
MPPNSPAIGAASVFLAHASRDAEFAQCVLERAEATLVPSEIQSEKLKLTQPVAHYSFMKEHCP